MPITQDRMIRLINASTNLISVYTTLLNTVTELRGTKDSEIQRALDELSIAGVHRNTPGIERLIDAHDAIIDRIIAHAPDYTDASNIAEERAHFNARRSINDKSRQAAQMRRRQDTEAIKEKSSYIELPIPEIDIHDLHRQIYAAQKANPHIKIRERDVGAIITRMGEPTLDIQFKLIAQLKALSLVSPEQFGDLDVHPPSGQPKDQTQMPNQENTTDQTTDFPQDIPVSDQGGLLPDRIIGLRPQPAAPSAPSETTTD